jgi:(5-formylfuran-3-yl)methyl phosphate synthase
MQLLVSVKSAAEASAALAGGADIVDAKDPAVGALGAVSLDEFRAIAAAVAGARPVSAALGDAANESTLTRSAHAFAAAGASFLKVGFAGASNAARVEALIAAAVRGAGLQACGTRSADALRHVVAVAYADANRAASIPHDRLIDVAARAGARGVLLDTFDKRGGGLRELLAARDLAAWVAAAHDAGLFAALAGKLTASDLPLACDLGADIAGVRGAACDGGRTDRVSADRVRLLRSACKITPAEVCHEHQSP